MSDQQTKERSGQQLSAPPPSKFLHKPLKECQTLEEAFQTLEFRERIEASVPRHVQPGRMLRTFVSAVSKTPKLAQASLRSFIGACLTASQVGLEPNTPLGHLWLIPFDTKRNNQSVTDINIVFGYPGLLDLSYRSGMVVSVHADVVWPGDDFSYEYGTNAHLRHRPKGLYNEGDRPVYAYMHAALRDGQAYEVMPYSEVLKIRNMSQAYRYALAAKQNAENASRRLPPAWTEAPWVKFEVAMARKTIFRAGSKWLPRSIEVSSAIALDEAQERGRRMDFSTVLDAPTIDGTPDYMGAAVEAAENQAEDDQPPRDPGATFGVRQEPPQQTTLRQPAREEPPAFEAILLDEFGEPTEEGRPYLSAVAFARAVVERRDKMTDVALSNQFNEFNAEAIADALQDRAAAALLGGLQGGQSAPPADTPIVGVEVPTDRGSRLSWTGYVRAFKAALEGVPMASLDRWIEAQRVQLEACPLAQRIQCVQALNAHASGEPLPSWLAEVVQATPAPKAEPPKTADPDGQWVDWIGAQLQGIAALDDPEEAQKQLSALTENADTVRTMTRLRAQRTILFETARTTFARTQAAITNRREGGD